MKASMVKVWASTSGPASQVSRLSENLKDPLGHKPFRVLALPPLNGCLQQCLHVFEEEIQYKLASICLRSPNHEGTQ